MLECFFFFRKLLNCDSVLWSGLPGVESTDPQARRLAPLLTCCHCGEITLNFPMLHFSLLERRNGSGFSPIVSLGRLKTAGKESACNAGDLGSIPGLGRSPKEGNGYLL